MQRAQTAGKEIVTVSGEAHTWHKEIQNGITHHVVNQFRADDGTWAYAVWDKVFTLYKVTGDNKKTILK